MYSDKPVEQSYSDEDKLHIGMIMLAVKLDQRERRIRRRLERKVYVENVRIMNRKYKDEKRAHLMPINHDCIRKLF